MSGKEGVDMSGAKDGAFGSRYTCPVCFTPQQNIDVLQSHLIIFHTREVRQWKTGGRAQP
jgi:hypothetical protein